MQVVARLVLGVLALFALATLTGCNCPKKCIGTDPCYWWDPGKGARAPTAGINIDPCR